MPFSFETDKFRWLERARAGRLHLLARSALCAALIGAPLFAQEAEVAADAPLVEVDPASPPAPDPVAPPEAVTAEAPAPVLPPICADAGVPVEECLAVLAGFSFEGYCRLNDVPAVRCLDFIRDFRMPVTCTSAELTLTGCIDFLDRQTRRYREMVKGLIAQCTAGDAGVCTAAEGELALLRDQLFAAEARAGGLDAELDSLRAETGTLRADLDAARAALDAAEASPANVCRAAALRLNARAEAALGAGAPRLDETACAANPIAEVTRFVALLSAPDPVKADALLRDESSVPPPAATPAPPAPGEAACVALPTDGELGFFLIEQDGLFGGLGPVRQNVLVNSLLKGEPAVEAVEKAWPKPLEDAERIRADEAARLLCVNFPATCPAGDGVEVCR